MAAPLRSGSTGLRTGASARSVAPPPPRRDAGPNRKRNLNDPDPDFDVAGYTLAVYWLIVPALVALTGGVALPLWSQCFPALAFDFPSNPFLTWGVGWVLPALVATLVLVHSFSNIPGWGATVLTPYSAWLGILLAAVPAAWFGGDGGLVMILASASTTATMLTLALIMVVLRGAMSWVGRLMLSIPLSVGAGFGLLALAGMFDVTYAEPVPACGMVFGCFLSMYCVAATERSLVRLVDKSSITSAFEVMAGNADDLVSLPWTIWWLLPKPWYIRALFGDGD